MKTSKRRRSKTGQGFGTNETMKAKPHLGGARPGSGRKPFQDEFTHLPVSRQRKWQLRRRKEDRCIICGNKPANGGRCREHRKKQLMARGYRARVRS